MSVYTDPQVARADLHQIQVVDGHIQVGDFKDWFYEYLDRGRDQARRGKRGHASYASLLQALKDKDRRAYIVFVSLTDGGKKQTEVAVDLGISTHEVRKLLKIAETEMKLSYREGKYGNLPPVLTHDEQRILGMAIKYREKDIADLLDLTPEHVQRVVQSAVRKLRNAEEPRHDSE